MSNEKWKAFLGLRMAQSRYLLVLNYMLYVVLLRLIQASKDRETV